MSINSRKRANGKVVYDVRLRAADGRAYKRTFRTKTEAKNFESQEVADRSRGGWVDPRAGQVRFAEYADRWAKGRPDLRPRSRELYDSLLRCHLVPAFGETELVAMSTASIRSWHAGLLAAGRPGPTTVAKCYRLLRMMLATAVEDGLLVKNPCIIKRAGVERTAERPVATIAQVEGLADVVDSEYSVMVQLATYAGLRFGELAALKGRSFDLERGTVTVSEQVVELNDGRLFFGPPKTEAGRWTVTIPPHLLDMVAAHVDRAVGSDLDRLVFPDSDGGPIRRSNFNRRVWQPACKTVGLVGFRFHDLRHTGNTLAAATGASTRELMARMGHASPRAALIYQHATADRDAAIAEALSDLVRKEVPDGAPT